MAAALAARRNSASRGAQGAPYELCTKLMDAAVAAGAPLRIGPVEGVDEGGGEGGALDKVDPKHASCEAYCLDEWGSGTCDEPEPPP